MPIRPQLLVALLVPLAACAPDTSTTIDIAPLVTDSAGIRIVTYDHTPVTAAPFQLAPQPRYRHGARPGDFTFQEVTVGRLLPDGRAVVYDPWIVEAVVFSRDGSAHRVLAAEGEGPGEVQFVDDMFALGQDSILMADPSLGRATLFVGDSMARMWSLPRGTRMDVVGTAQAGELLMATSSGQWEFEGPWLAGHMATLDIETGVLDTVASFDFFPRIPPGMQVDPIAAIGEVTVAPGHFVQTRSDTPEVTWRLPDGTVTQIVRWRAEATLLTEEWLEPIAAENRRGVRMHQPDLSDARIERATRAIMAVYDASIGRPMPLFASPFADDEGRIWLPSYRPGGELKSVPPYTVIAPDGQWLGTVEAPPGFRILDVAGGLVLGVARDEMDVESVVVWELVGG